MSFSMMKRIEDDAISYFNDNLNFIAMHLRCQMTQIFIKHGDDAARRVTSNHFSFNIIFIVEQKSGLITCQIYLTCLLLADALVYLLQKWYNPSLGIGLFKTT